MDLRYSLLAKPMHRKQNDSNFKKHITIIEKVKEVQHAKLSKTCNLDSSRHDIQKKTIKKRKHKTKIFVHFLLPLIVSATKHFWICKCKAKN